MRIIVDIDEVLRDTVPTILNIYNRELKPLREPKKTIDDVYCWDLTQALPEIKNQFYTSENFFRHYSEKIFLESPHDIEMVETVNYLGRDHKIILASSQFQGLEELTCKWLNEMKELYPLGTTKVHTFINYDELFFTHNKGILPGDVMLDDNPNNFCGFKGVRLLYDKPWNKDSKLTRIKSPEEFRTYIDSITTKRGKI